LRCLAVRPQRYLAPFFLLSASDPTLPIPSPPHPNASHRIPSHPIPSHPIPSHPILRTAACEAPSFSKAGPHLVPQQHACAASTSNPRSIRPPNHDGGSGKCGGYHAVAGYRRLSDPLIGAADDGARCSVPC
jgi:hypothetical protein